jgi:hypothetical protein
LRTEIRHRITIMQMNEEMDAGDIVQQVETPVDSNENADELLQRLAVLGAQELLGVLAREQSEGRLLPRRPQDASQATMAPLLTTDMALVNWRADAKTVSSHIRAFDSKPGAYAFFGDVRLKVFRPVPIKAPAAEPAGCWEWMPEGWWLPARRTQWRWENCNGPEAGECRPQAWWPDIPYPWERSCEEKKNELCRGTPSTGAGSFGPRGKAQCICIHRFRRGGH